jgi:disulfide bond formation protein DsbB
MNSNQTTSLWHWLGKNALMLALIQAIVAFLWSMYYSNIAGFTPCVLCWYQRICMFPLFVALIVGILRKDAKVYMYVLPPAIVGWVIAFYHNLLYYKIIPDTLAPCTTGVSCTTKFIEYFGFVTIPLLSFLAFSVIIFFMLRQRAFLKSQSLSDKN